MLHRNGSVKLIRREETIEDYLRTFDFEPKRITPKKEV